MMSKAIRNTYGRTVVRILNSSILPDYVDPEEEPKFFGSAGTGVLYRPQDHDLTTNLEEDDMCFMTNAHVVDAAAMLFVNHPEWGSLRLRAEAVGAFRANDKALIVVRGMRQKIAKLSETQTKYAADLQKWFDEVQALGALPFPTREQLSDMVDRECFIVGFPLNQANQVITKGVISSIQLFQVDQERTLLLFQTDAAMNHGNSGGAMMVEFDGQVYYAGIPSLGIPSASNIGYVLPYHHVKSTMHGFVTHPESILSPTKSLPKRFLNVEGPYRGMSVAFQQGENDGYLVGQIDTIGCPFDVLEGDLIVQVGDAVVGDDGLLQLPWTDVRIPYATAFDELDLALGEATLTVIRQGQRLEVGGEWEFDANLAIRELFGGLEPLRFEAFGGMVISELNVNQAQAIPSLSVFLPRRNRLVPRLAVVTVDRMAESPVEPGWLVVQVNGRPVQTYEDWQQELVDSVDTNTMTITFNTLEGVKPTLEIGNLEGLIEKTLELSRIRNERVTDGVEKARFKQKKLIE
jgi:S1-C subfamily serine protease